MCILEIIKTKHKCPVRHSVLKALGQLTCLKNLYVYYSFELLFNFDFFKNLYQREGVGGRTGEEKGAYGTFGEWGPRKGEII